MGNFHLPMLKSTCPLPQRSVFRDFFFFQSPTNSVAALAINSTSVMPSDLDIYKLLRHQYIVLFAFLSCIMDFPPEQDNSNDLQQWHLNEAHVQAETSDPGPVIILIFPSEATPGEVPCPHLRSGPAPLCGSPSPVRCCHLLPRRRRPR